MAAQVLKGADSLKAKLKALAAKIDKPGSVSVGFMGNEGSTYDNGTSVAMVAAIQEFGAPRVGIPPRPYFRTMIKKESPRWGKALGAYLEEANMDVPAALGMLGQLIAGQLRQSIIDLSEPALSPVTLMLREMMHENPSLRDNMSQKIVMEARARVAAGDDYSGASTKPLIDTGKMLNSITYEVKDTAE